MQAWLSLINANVGEPHNLYEEEVVVVGKSDSHFSSFENEHCQERKIFLKVRRVCLAATL